MIRNPEFRRHLWLELSPARLVTMPLTIALVAALVWLSNDHRFDDKVAAAAGALFAVVTIAWGAKLVADSLYEELIGRTWDWQRMSGVSPWSLTWGKWLGASLYPWYGGGWALLCFLPAMAAGGRTVDGVKLALLLVVAALLFQGMAMTLALLSLRRGEVTPRHRSAMSLLVLLLTLAAPPLIAALADEKQLHWYRLTLPPLDFWLASGVLWTAWIALGAYRLMRAELQHRGGPLWWLLFLLFAAAWGGGFAATVADRLLIAFGIGATFALGCAFIEPKDPVAWRALLRAWREERWREVWSGLPLWPAALAVAAAAAVALLAVPAAGAGAPRSLPLLMLGFLVRDIALLFFFSLGPRNRRPEATTLIYLLVLYWPLPLLLRVLAGDPLTALLWPRPDLAGPWPAAAAAAGAAAALLLLAGRWRRGFGTAAGGR